MGDPSLIWYVAYGSNLDADRLRCYLEGGTAPGRTAANAGARDPRPPQADRPVRIPLPLHFVGRAAAWGGGGFAALGHRRTAPAPTLGRAWLLTLGQLSDVLDQESGRDPGTTTTVDLARLAVDGVVEVGTGAYDRVVALDPLDGRPALTFTTLTDPAVRVPSAPSPAYRRTIAAGLRAAHGLDDAAIDAYLRTATDER